MQKLLGEYVTWLQSSNAHEGSLYKDSFATQWPPSVYPNTQVHLETYELLKKLDRVSLRVIENCNSSAASKLFEQEIREVVSSKVFRQKTNMMWLGAVSAHNQIIIFCEVQNEPF